jgi:hypothetical protein
MAAVRILDRISSMGAAAQAFIPGAYAWGVTVLPAALSRSGSIISKVAAFVALAALAFGVQFERHRGWGTRARFVSFWGFVLASAITWAATPTALLPLRIDAPRGIAGMLGWALYALVSAAPALGGRREAERVVDEDPLPARRRLSGGDMAYVVVASVVAAALQLVGWRVGGAERALLVRFISLAAGVAVVGAATQIALARHAGRTVRSARRRIRRSVVAIVVFGILVLSGVIFALRD